MLASLTRTLLLAAATLPCVLSSSLATTPKPPPPASDPFYQPSKGFKSTAPGTILKSRAINTTVLSANNGEAYQLLYRTTAINGSAIATVTTIFKPKNASLDRFVSFHTAYDSSATQCDPSYTYQSGANQTDLITSFEQSILKDYLNKGYIVASPDYEGPDAAFSAGRLAGMAVLDGMRAVTAFGSTLGFTTKTPAIVGVGYSGGAIATGWAASLQANYAKALPIKGWSMGGTPANLTGTLLYLDNSTFSGFLPAAVAGLVKPSAYLAQVQELLDTIATAEGLAYLQYAATHCAVDDIVHFPGKSILSTQFQTLGAAFPFNPKVAAVLADNLMGARVSETPLAPVYMYHAKGDEIIPYANASALATTWCNNGAKVQFNTVLVGGHATTEINGLSNAMKFVASAFAGTVTSGCARTSSLVVKDSAALFEGVSDPAAEELQRALNIAGPNDANIKNDLSTLKIPVTE